MLFMLIKRKKYILTIGCAILLLGGFTSCKKYLDAKSDKLLSTPETIADLQALLDDQALNRALRGLNEGADEYYATTPDLLRFDDIEQQGYIWDKQANGIFGSYDWNSQYKNVFTVNTVLDNLQKIPATGQEEKWNNVKGSALFWRAHYFYQLAQIYAKQYDKATAATDAGIALRVTSDFNKPTVRASVQETYDRIVQDINEAIPLLPKSPKNSERPGRPAAFALLARINMIMGNFSAAKINCDSCLNLYNTLLDYNTIPNLSAETSPFPRMNAEVIFDLVDGVSNILNGYSIAKIDSTLYQSFADNDLRKIGFFKDNGDGTYRFKGNYTGEIYYLFNGIATDEMYLMRAECNARLGNTETAMQDLNTLLKKRYDPSFVELTASTPEAALLVILSERKKELIYRGLRWVDLRRLNKEPQFQVTLKREFNGIVYTLLPNDLKYVYLIPQDVIRMSGIAQNPR